MSIVNKSKNTWFPNVCLDYLEYPGTYVDEDIKRCFSKEEQKEIINQYGSRYNYRTKKYDSTIINWEELIHYLHVAEDLNEWQGIDWTKCSADYAQWDKKNNCILWEPYDLSLDGYAQCKYQYSGEPDTQCFANRLWVNVFVATVDGGICCHIDKKTSQAKFYGIGEDDGYWFIVNELWIRDIPMLKRYLMSEVSELHIEEIDHQKIIENIWNSDLKIETKYRH